MYIIDTRSISETTTNNVKLKFIWNWDIFNIVLSADKIYLEKLVCSAFCNFVALLTTNVCCCVYVMNQLPSCHPSPVPGKQRPPDYFAHKCWTVRTVRFAVQLNRWTCRVWVVSAIWANVVNSGVDTMSWAGDTSQKEVGLVSSSFHTRRASVILLSYEENLPLTHGCGFGAKDNAKVILTASLWSSNELCVSLRRNLGGCYLAIPRSEKRDWKLVWWRCSFMCVSGHKLLTSGDR